MQLLTSSSGGGSRCGPCLHHCHSQLGAWPRRGAYGNVGSKQIRGCRGGVGRSGCVSLGRPAETPALAVQSQRAARGRGSHVQEPTSHQAHANMHCAPLLPAPPISKAPQTGFRPPTCWIGFLSHFLEHTAKPRGRQVLPTESPPASVSFSTGSFLPPSCYCLLLTLGTRGPSLLPKPPKQPPPVPTGASVDCEPRRMQE